MTTQLLFDLVLAHSITAPGWLGIGTWLDQGLAPGSVTRECRTLEAEQSIARICLDTWEEPTAGGQPQELWKRG